jgi:serine/threonine protein kinase
MCEDFFDKHVKRLDTIKTDWSITDFTKSKFLGKGKYGSVDLYVEKSSGIKYAIKTIHISEKNTVDKDTLILKEILHQIIVSGHPNICSIVGTFRIDCDLMCVQEMCGTDMFKINFKDVSTDIKVKWITGLLSAVEHCHRLGILHLDIKLANCLITEDNVLKLSDFGFSQNIDHLHHRVMGTPNYIAPEIAIAIYDNTQDAYISKAADVWACGIIFVFMFQPSVFLQKNSKRVTLFELMTQIVSHRVTSSDLHAVPDLYKAVVLEMLEHSYKTRISSREALRKFKELQTF